MSSVPKINFSQYKANNNNTTSTTSTCNGPNTNRNSTMGGTRSTINKNKPTNDPPPIKTSISLEDVQFQSWGSPNQQSNSNPNLSAQQNKHKRLSASCSNLANTAVPKSEVDLEELKKVRFQNFGNDSKGQPLPPQEDSMGRKIYEGFRELVFAADRVKPSYGQGLAYLEKSHHKPIDKKHQ